MVLIGFFSSFLWLSLNSPIEKRMGAWDRVKYFEKLLDYEELFCHMKDLPELVLNKLENVFDENSLEYKF